MRRVSISCRRETPLHFRPSFGLSVYGTAAAAAAAVHAVAVDSEETGGYADGCRTWTPELPQVKLTVVGVDAYGIQLVRIRLRTALSLPPGRSRPRTKHTNTNTRAHMYTHTQNFTKSTKVSPWYSG